MAKVSLLAGTTSYIAQVFIQDSSSTTGAGLGSLVFNTASLSAYYHRDTDTTATAITLVTMTVGTFTSSGFAAIDGTNMLGAYQLCVPNAAFASGAKSVMVMLKGATNMAPLVLEIELTAVNNQSATAFITGVNSLAPPTNWNLTSIDANGRLDMIKVAGTTQTARDIGASVLLSSGTGTGQLDFTSGVVKGNAVQILGTAVSTPATAGILDVNVKNIDNDAASASGTVTFPNATLASTTNITAGTITTVTNLTNAATSGDLTATMKTSVTTAATAATPTAAAVTGAVGSVTGNVGGSVASVTARVTANTDQLAGQTVTAAAGVTFPTSVASPTNITAGTITTVTNLTNAPTAGDFTATMKTSITTAVPTAAGVATSVWTDLLAGSDFSTASSIGKLLKDDVDAAISSRMATYTQPTGFLAATFPGTVASTTNITGGTITTVTNLTNAATSGDLTATMKTSVTTAATAATPIAASVTGAVGSVTGSVGGNVTGSVGSVMGAVGSVTGNVGGNLTGSIGSLSSTAKTNVEDATWDAVLANHLDSGSTGAALNAAGAAGDPWTTALPGAYGAGTAGYIVGTNLDATVASRLPTSSYTSPPSSATNATAVWAKELETGFTAGDELRLTTAAAAGGITSGAGGAAFTIRDLNNTKNRVVAATDGTGNRTSFSTLNGT